MLEVLQLIVIPSVTLKSVENRQSDIKLTIEFSFSGELETSYTVKSQSMHILNMAPHLLTIRQRTNAKKCYDYAIHKWFSALMKNKNLHILFKFCESSLCESMMELALTLVILS